MDINISAVLITGGWDYALHSAEIYHTDRDTPCALPDLPDQRVFHTQDGSLVCGGGYTLRSCRRWNADTGAWDLVTETLTEKRWAHTSWTPVDGSVTYLMGGFWSDNTTEVLDNGSVRITFPPKHRTR